MTLSEKLTFFNKRSVYTTLEEVTNGSEITIDMSNSKYIDSDIEEIIEEFKGQAKEREISVSLIK